MTAGYVSNGQPAMGEADAILGAVMKPFAIGATMTDGMCHCPKHILILRPGESGNSTHEC